MTQSGNQHQHDVLVNRIDRVSSTRIRLTIEFPMGTLADDEQRTAQRYSSSVKLPGFRTGKAPLSLVMNRFRDEIRKDVIKHLLDVGLSHALEKTKLAPVSRPSINVGELHFDRSKPFQFVAEFEVQPEIEIRNYKEIPLIKPSITVEENEIQSTLEVLREKFSVLEPMDAERPESGCFGIIELGYESTGPPPFRESPTEMTVELGAGKLLAQLDKVVLQMKVGEERVVEATFPVDHPNKGLAGRPALFRCRLIELKRKNLPELNDTFANQVKSGTTLQSLREEIHAQILSQKEGDHQRRQRESLVNYLVQHNPFDVAETLVQKQTISMLRTYEDGLKRQGIVGHQPTEGEFRSIRQRADRMVRSALVLREVARKEKISVDESRVEARVEALSYQLKKPKGELQKWLVDNRVVDQIRDEVLTDQVFEFLMKYAQITQG